MAERSITDGETFLNQPAIEAIAPTFIAKRTPVRCAAAINVVNNKELPSVLAAASTRLSVVSEN